jgi:RNA polymerase sigma-70 factor, ECF subfamily
VTTRFEQIYAEHHDAVRAYVRRRAPEQLVDDLVGDVFLVCLRRIDDVPPHALPWLYGVARKTLANERRRRARTAPAEVATTYDPEPLGDSGLAAAFAELSERDREVLRLVAWEGLALHDAATAIGCSPLAARVRYHRAKSRLAAKLEARRSFRPEPKGVTR